MVSIDDVQKLRKQTFAPVVECKKALEEAKGDFSKASEILKKKGALRAEKKQENDTKCGIVEAYIHSNNQLGTLVELRCETSFVANNPDFKKLAYDLAMHITALNPQYVSSKEISEEIIEEKKKEYQEEFKKSNKSPEIVKKIVEGKLEKEFQEVCLNKQAFIKDETKNIDQLIQEAIAKFGENIEISRFIRFRI
ncbi:MAG TPA: elongation factor Ts [Candidatus Paceibacterota bacterium]|nr:elongation factor Ts [Candidatus Paceibacterota bacterium]